MELNRVRPAVRLDHNPATCEGVLVALRTVENDIYEYHLVGFSRVLKLRSII